VKSVRARVLHITQLGEPVLRRRLRKVGQPTSDVVKKLTANMLATMRKAQGVGIAANQVGVDQRIFIVAPEPSARYPQAPEQPPIVMINPVLRRHSKATIADWEGCLSIPGIRAKVPRYKTVEIEFMQLDGKRYRARLKDFVARIFQHEFDHINGLVYLDRVQDSRTFMTEAEYRKRLS
jgi:peptide deformylase